MDLEELRRQLRAGTVGELPIAARKSEPKRFSPLEAIRGKVEKPVKHHIGIDLLNITDTITFAKKEDEAEKLRASIPVNLTVGRAIASLYEGLRTIEVTFPSGTERTKGLVLMVHPCWVPGLEGETRPTPEDETCYHVEVEVIWPIREAIKSKTEKVLKENEEELEKALEEAARITKPDPGSAGYTEPDADSKPFGNWKEPVRLATGCPLPSSVSTGRADGKRLAGMENGKLFVDDFPVEANDRILVKDEKWPWHNGIYNVVHPGDADSLYVLVRTFDACKSEDFTAGMSVFVFEGHDNGNTGWVLATAPLTVDTSALTFERIAADISGAGFADGIVR